MICPLIRLKWGGACGFSPKEKEKGDLQRQLTGSGQCQEAGSFIRLYLHFHTILK
jgi:hypothetical protein